MRQHPCISLSVDNDTQQKILIHTICRVQVENFSTHPVEEKKIRRDLFRS